MIRPLIEFLRPGDTVAEGQEGIHKVDVLEEHPLGLGGELHIGKVPEALHSQGNEPVRQRLGHALRHCQHRHVGVVLLHIVFQLLHGPDLACYGFAQTSGELDDALQALNRVYSDLLELAQAEKTVQLLAQDIERTRRRVNALEYVVIPENQRNIRYITMKLEENERGNTTRLMKVKDMVLQDAHHYKS